MCALLGNWSYPNNLFIGEFVRDLDIVSARENGVI